MLGTTNMSLATSSGPFVNSDSAAAAAAAAVPGAAAGGLSPDHQQTPKKQRKPRIQACDRCRTRKRKCNGARPVCSNCTTARARGQLEVACSYAEKKKRPRRQRRDVLLSRLEALEQLLKPFQAAEAACGAAGSSVGASQAATSAAVAATRAEIAGIMQGLAARGSISTASTRTESAENLYDGDMDADGDADGDGSDSSGGENSDGESYGESHTTGSYGGSSSMHAVMNGSGGHRRRQSTWDGSQTSSAAMTDPGTNSTTNIPLFDAIAWPALVAEDEMMESSELTYTISPSHFSPAPPPSVMSVGTTAASSPMSNATHAPSLSPRAVVPQQEPPHLFTHLIALYFEVINPCMPVFDEEDFFANLIPVNNHPPAVLYAMYAYATPYSRHPALFEELYGNPLAASELFHAEATRSLDGIQNQVTRMQVLIMLGKWNFGMNQVARAYQLLSAAIQASERSRLGYFGGHEKQRLIPLWGPAPVDAPLHTLKSMRATWALCFTADTYISMTTDVGLAIEESSYVHLLAEAVEGARAVAADPTLALADIRPPQEGDGSWRRILEGHPSFSVQDFRPHAWSPPVDQLEVACSQTKPWFLQLQFILRRITRFCRAVPFDSHMYDGTSAGIVLSVLPNSGGATPMTREAERSRLHDVLLEWWASIPATERAFDDLNAFRSGNPVPPLPSVAQLGSYQYAMMNVFFVAAFSHLHHREEGTIDAMPGNSAIGYATRRPTSPAAGSGITTTSSSSSSPQQPPSPPPRATSREILGLALRAQVFLIRSIYAANGFDSIPPAPSTNSSATNYVGFSPQHPPPPAILIQNPMTLYACWSAAEAALVDLSRTPRGSAEREAMTKEMFALVAGVFLPVLDSSVRIWPVGRVYAERLRDAAHKIQKGEVVRPMRAQLVGINEVNERMGSLGVGLSL
ncbi:hypothetical protein BDZ88DRAFT_506460 [Geranomyces variabilis]|nr:hypothetical protein BDZ88DRAFT_506460 [Geranomyces variabilis]